MSAIEFSPAVARDLWRKAYLEEIGIAFTIGDAKMAYVANMFYEARKSIGDPELDKLMLCQFSKDNEIWLIHKTTEID